MNLEEGPFNQLHGVWVFKALNEKACKISLDLSFDYAGSIVRATLGAAVQSGGEYLGGCVLPACQSRCMAEPMIAIEVVYAAVDRQVLRTVSLR